MERNRLEGEPHSIWLLPEPATSQEISDTISMLSSDFNAPKFAPHLTVLGDLNGPTETSNVLCRELFQGMGSIGATLLGFERSESYFTAAVLDMDLGAEFEHLRREFSRRIENREPPRFRPHISLAYGIPIESELAPRVQSKIDIIMKRPIVFDRIATVRSTKTLPIHDWEILNTVKL